MFGGGGICQTPVDRDIESFTRVARSRKADALRKVYAKYGDKVDIVIVEDLVKGDFADALKCVSAVIHVATPMPGHEELRDILEVGYLPAHSDPQLTPVFLRSPERGRSTDRPPGCHRRCQTYLLRWICCRLHGLVQPGDQGTFVRQRLEPSHRGAFFGFRQRDPRLWRREDTSRASPLEIRGRTSRIGPHNWYVTASSPVRRYCP